MFLPLCSPFTPTCVGSSLSPLFVLHRDEEKLKTQILGLVSEYAMVGGRLIRFPKCLPFSLLDPCLIRWASAFLSFSGCISSLVDDAMMMHSRQRMGRSWRSFLGRDISVLTHVCCLIECPVDNREQIMLAVWCSAKAAYLDIFPKLKAPVLDNYSRPRDGSLLMFFCGREVSVLTDVCCLIECPANNHEQLC